MNDEAEKSLYRRLRPYAMQALRVVLAVYLLALGALMWFEGLLIYPTWQIPAGDWAPDDLDYVGVDFPSADGTKLHGWYFEHVQPKAHVLYCHGNGEHVAHLGSYMEELRDTYQVSVFVFDYRGYGKSDGKPNEAGVIADGQAAQFWLSQRNSLPPDRIVLWGRSIGGAVAAQLAAQNGARALIMERTFSSLTEVASSHFPWLPIRTLLSNRFDSESVIGRYNGPVLQSHGTEDEVVPYELGQKLFNSVVGEPKIFVTIPGGTHNGPSSREYYTKLQHFLANMP